MTGDVSAHQLESEDVEDEFFTEDEFDRLDETGEVDYAQGRSRRPGLRDHSMILQTIRAIQQPFGGLLKLEGY